MAEMGAGAEGWASGSQAWKGIRAALSPKPQMNRAEQAATTQRESVSWSPRATAAKLTSPVTPKRTAIPMRTKAEATTESMRYLKDASSSSGPSPKATRA